MRYEPKILKDGESTYRNGAGSMCGGVVSESTFYSDPMLYMMAHYMEDDKFEIYKRLKSSTDKKDQQKATKWFKKYAISAI